MNLYTEDKKKKRPVSTSAIVRIVIWSLVLVILCGVFSLCMFGTAFGGGIWKGLGMIGGYSYKDAASYNVGAGQEEASVSEIDIEWWCGNIDIVPVEGESVIIEEDYTGDDEDLRVRWKIENGKLRVQYRAPCWFIGWVNVPAKKLTIGIPASMLENLKDVNIDSVDSDVTFAGNTEELSLDLVDGSLTASGRIGQLNLDGVDYHANVNGSIERLDLDGVAIRANVSGSVQKVDVDGINLTIELHLTEGMDVDVDGVDTTVSLYLADSITGFAVRKDGMAGKATITGYEGVTEKGEYDEYWGDGSLRIDLDGIDSELKIEKETKD